MIKCRHYMDDDGAFDLIEVLNTTGGNDRRGMRKSINSITANQQYLRSHLVTKPVCFHPTPASSSCIHMAFLIRYPSPLSFTRFASK